MYKPMDGPPMDFPPPKEGPPPKGGDGSGSGKGFDDDPYLKDLRDTNPFMKDVKYAKMKEPVMYADDFLYRSFRGGIVSAAPVKIDVEQMMIYEKERAAVLWNEVPGEEE